MTKRFVVLDGNNVVQNAIIWDGAADWTPPQGFTAMQSDVGNIGDAYENGEFVPAPPPTP